MFNFEFDKRTLYIVLAILVLVSLAGFNESSLLGLLLTLPGLLVAITFHEFAHAYVADKLGDDTPRLQGRLNLNPLSHLDPVGSILLLFAHFGWGKPVEINPRNFNRKYTMEQGEAMVSAAGPIMNFILAIVISVIVCAINKFAGISFMQTTLGATIMTILTYAVIVNVGLGVFNLLPLPPLDGSKIFINFMPYNVKNWIQSNSNIFYIIFLVIWITGIAGQIVSPIIDAITSGIFAGVGWIFGLF